MPGGLGLSLLQRGRKDWVLYSITQFPFLNELAASLSICVHFASQNQMKTGRWELARVWCRAEKSLTLVDADASKRRKLALFTGCCSWLCSAETAWLVRQICQMAGRWTS